MPEPVLHHIGIVVASVKNDGPNWQASLGTLASSQIYDDPIQQARVAFFQFPNRGPGLPLYLELVEPLTENSPVSRFLANGGGLHHLCFEVNHLETQISAMKGRGAMLVRSPKPAVAFQGRRICWMLTRERLLVEYLEAQ
jgi:methylmalonyl-CoA/ethylmalonyl-CoA epimerase